jgi:hypothetical protein
MLARPIGLAVTFLLIVSSFGLERDVVMASSELEAALAESERLGLPLTAAQLSGEAPPDAENAAAGLLDQLTLWSGARKAAGIIDDPTRPRPAQVAALDDPMLDFAATLLARPKWHIERDYVTGPYFSFSELPRLKSLAKAYQWRAWQRSREGDVNGAIHDVQAAVRMAKHTAGEPSMSGGFSSAAIDHTAGTAALDMAMVFSENSSALRQIHQVMEDGAYDLLLVPSLRGEFYGGASLFRNLHHYGGMDFMYSMAVSSRDLPPPPPRRDLNDNDIPRDARQRATFARHLQFWNTVFDGEDQSLSAQSKRLYAENERVSRSLRPSETFLRVTMPIFAVAGNAFARQHVMQDMRRATVLAAAFRAEEGRWPKDLAEIGVEIKNPLSGEPVGYAAQGARITLWTPEPGMEDKGAVFQAKAGERLDTWRIIWPDPSRGSGQR